MKKKIIIGLIYAVVLGLVIFAGCSVQRQQPEIEYYNIIYTQNGVINYYQEATDLKKWEGKITFTACDGSTVILSDGCIEIIPLDLD